MCYHLSMQKGLIVHAVIFNEKREVLIIKRSPSERMYPNLWDIPGGTLEDGEDPAIGVMREVREETGLTISQVSLFDYTSNIDEVKNAQFVRLIFIAKGTEDTVVLDPEEHTEFAWVKVNGSNTNQFVPYIKEVFAHLNSGGSALLEFYR